MGKRGLLIGSDINGGGKMMGQCLQEMQSSEDCYNVYSCIWPT